MSRFQVERHNEDIRTYPLFQAGANPGITYSSEYGELVACIAVGLDPVKWMRGEYSISEKVTILAWYQADNLIQAHSHDAAARKAKQ